MYLRRCETTNGSFKFCLWWTGSEIFFWRLWVQIQECLFFIASPGVARRSFFFLFSESHMRRLKWVISHIWVLRKAFKAGESSLAVSCIAVPRRHVCAVSATCGGLSLLAFLLTPNSEWEQFNLWWYRLLCPSSQVAGMGQWIQVHSLPRFHQKHWA